MLTTYAHTLLSVAAATVGWTYFTSETSVGDERGFVSDSPREFGAVDWARRLEPALESSAIDGKPVMLLFQEVPG